MVVLYELSQAYPEYIVTYHTGVPNLDGADVHLAGVLELLDTPTIQAVRLHGSRNVQRLLDEVATRDEVVILHTRPPVVVLVGGDTHNTQHCAQFMLDAWGNALVRAGVARAERPAAPYWFVSNHTFAVAIEDNRTEVPQDRLPLGCKD